MISAESVKARLKQIAVRESKPFDFLLVHYFTERMIYRISISPYAENFILKGGMLLYTMLGNDARTTKDIDFLAKNISNTPEDIAVVVRTICSIDANDAVNFDLDSIKAEPIREGADYEGVRIKITGYLDRTRHVLQFDAGFGDVVIPKPVTLEYPTLLDMERPLIQAYSQESIIAEKFEAMLALSEVNSRMKDFYDIYTLSLRFSYKGMVLYKAIRETLKHRGTPLVISPSVFTDEFANMKEKQALWKAFQKRIRETDDPGFTSTMELIKKFLKPVYLAILSEKEWRKQWDNNKRVWE